MNDLLAVLNRTRCLLASPENNFLWSEWADQRAAIADLDNWIDRVKIGHLDDTSKLELLFAPTGSIQEVAVSSEWGGEFLELAQTFDEAIANFSA